MKEVTLSHFSIYFDRETIKKPLRFTQPPYLLPAGSFGRSSAYLPWLQ